MRILLPIHHVPLPNHLSLALYTHDTMVAEGLAGILVIINQINPHMLFLQYKPKRLNGSK